MMSSKLTKSQKESAVSKLTEETFKERETEIEERKKELGDRVYFALVGEDFVAHPAVTDVTSSFHAYILGHHAVLNMTLPRPVGLDGWLNSGHLPEDSQRKFREEYREVETHAVKVCRDRNAFRDTIVRAIDKITSAKKLVELYPALESYLHDSYGKELVVATQVLDLATMVESAKRTRP